MLPFDYSLDREAVAILLQCTAREQRFLVDTLNTLARHPSSSGDYTYVDADKRENQVIDVGAFVITFWTDHAARVVRILAIERV